MTVPSPFAVFAAELLCPDESEVPDEDQHLGLELTHSATVPSAGSVPTPDPAERQALADRIRATVAAHDRSCECGGVA